MDVVLKRAIVDGFESRVDALGFAPVERFGDAPEKHHPSSLCKDAQTVIVIGKTVPKGMLHSPGYSLYFTHRSYHSVYPLLDEMALEVCNLIEKQGHLAVPVPSFAPLTFHGPEPWGILSLKHAAALTGTGAFGRSGMVYHPQYGSMLRFGAVVTSAVLPGDEIIKDDPCPSKCRACMDACPSGAFSEDGFAKMKCRAYTIRHGIYPLALKDEESRKNVEMIINTAGYNYWLNCIECLKACPNNNRKPR